jgi:hypothetical protein
MNREANSELLTYGGWVNDHAHLDKSLLVPPSELLRDLCLGGNRADKGVVRVGAFPRHADHLLDGRHDVCYDSPRLHHGNPDRQRSGFCFTTLQYLTKCTTLPKALPTHLVRISPEVKGAMYAR